MRVEHIGDATLYLADCMDIMRDMPDKAFDIAIVDPPYGGGVNHAYGGRFARYTPPTEDGRDMGEKISSGRGFL